MGPSDIVPGDQTVGENGTLNFPNIAVSVADSNTGPLTVSAENGALNADGNLAGIAPGTNMAYDGNNYYHRTPLDNNGFPAVIVAPGTMIQFQNVSDPSVQVCLGWPLSLDILPLECLRSRTNVCAWPGAKYKS